MVLQIQFMHGLPGQVGWVFKMCYHLPNSLYTNQSAKRVLIKAAFHCLDIHILSCGYIFRYIISLLVILVLMFVSGCKCQRHIKA